MTQRVRGAWGQRREQNGWVVKIEQNPEKALEFIVHPKQTEVQHVKAQR